MKNKLTLKVLGFVCLSALLDSSAQILMKKGLLIARTDFSDFGGILGFLFQNPSSHWVWAGVALYFLNFFIWMIILSQLELSTAVPLTSLNYILLPLLALFFLNEKINGTRWLGIVFIISGIYFITKNSHSKRRESSPV